MFVKDLLLSADKEKIAKAIDADSERKTLGYIYVPFLLSGKQTTENILNAAKNNNKSNSNNIIKIRIEDRFGPFMIKSLDSDIRKGENRVKDMMWEEWDDVLSCEVPDNEIKYYGIEIIAQLICVRMSRLGSSKEEVHNNLIKYTKSVF